MKNYILSFFYALIALILPQSLQAQTDLVRVDGWQYNIRNNSFTLDVQLPSEYLESYNFADYDGSAVLYPNRYGQTIGSYSLEGEVIVPETITTNDKTYLVQELLYAFYGCSKITNVTLPSSICKIQTAFSGCKALESIVLPPYIPVLYVFDFENCTSLKHIELPTYLAEIRSNCFSGCNALETIICNVGTPPTCFSDSFTETCYKKATLYVPDESLDEYRTAQGWKNFYTIKPLSELEEGDSTVISILDKDYDKSNIVYDLYGRAVGIIESDNIPSNLHKGIYIVNGKKIMVK